MLIHMYMYISTYRIMADCVVVQQLISIILFKIMKGKVKDLMNSG